MLKQSSFKPLKPQLATVIAVLTLAGGVVSFLMGGLVALSSGCCWLTWVLQIGVGIWAIIHGIQMLQSDNVAPSMPIAILFCVCILGCDPLTLIAGILILVFMQNPEVKEFYAIG